MNKKIYIFFSLFLVSTFGLFSQEVDANSFVFKQELALDSVFKKMRNSKTNKDRIKYNNLFKKELIKTLEDDESFEYKFDSLKTMSKIVSPDNKFRLFNWNIEMEGGINRFYCFVLKSNGRIIELRDNYRNITQPEHKSLTNKNWYGALYYKIIKLKKGKYTLLGWNGDDQITTQKIIEVMILKRKSIKFGETIFNFEDKRIRKKRIIMKYSNDAIVSLKYFNFNEEQEIVFSHISPSIPQMEGHFEYYYPDLSYDKFVLKKGKWFFKSDSQVKNKKSKMDDNYNTPE